MNFKKPIYDAGAWVTVAKNGRKLMVRRARLAGTGYLYELSDGNFYAASEFLNSTKKGPG